MGRGSGGGHGCSDSPGRNHASGGGRSGVPHQPRRNIQHPAGYFRHERKTTIALCQLRRHVLHRMEPERVLSSDSEMLAIGQLDKYSQRGRCASELGARLANGAPGRGSDRRQSIVGCRRPRSPRFRSAWRCRALHVSQEYSSYRKGLRALAGVDMRGRRASRAQAGICFCSAGERRRKANA